MAEKAEVGTDNEEDMEAKIDSFPQKLPLTDAEAMGKRDLGMQSDGNGGGGILIGEKEDDLPSPPQSKEADNCFQSKDAYVDQPTVFPPPLHECDVSSPTQDESEQGGLVNAEDAPMDTEPKVEGLDEMRQGEAEQEPDVRAPAEMEQEPDVDALDAAEPNALGPLEAEPEQQDLVAIQPMLPALDEFEPDERVVDALEFSGSRSDLHVDDADEGFIEFEFGKMAVPQEGNIEEPQDQLVDDAIELSCMTAVNEELSLEDAGGGTNDVEKGEPELVDAETVVNPAVSKDRFQVDCAEPPANEQVDHETPMDNVFNERPATPFSDEAVLIKEPSLSTPAMEALVDVDDKEPLYKQQSYEILEHSEQRSDAEEAHEESAGGDRECAAEGISNQLELEVDNYEQERAENNAFDEDVLSAAAADSACEGLVSSGQELMTNVSSADEPDGKETELGNGAPFVFKQNLDTEQGSINEEPRIGSQSEQELDINAVEREPLAQSSDTVPSLSEQEMGAETQEKGDEAVSLVAEEGTIKEQELRLEAPITEQARDVEGGVAAVSALVEEDAVTSKPDETTTEMEPSGWALNSEQDFDNPDKKEKSLLEANHIDENLDRSSSPSEPLSEVEQDEPEICLSAHVLDNGDFLQSFPSTDNAGKAEGSYVGLSTVPVLEFGKVIDGTSKLEAPLLENGVAYHHTTPEADKQRTLEPHISESKDESNEVNEVGTQAVKAEDRDLNAGEESKIVGGAKGVAADMDATGNLKPLVLENGLLKHNEEDLEKESMGKEYTNGTASASIADMTTENAEVFHNERSREASLSLGVPHWASEKEDVEHMNGKVTLARRTNWWGCCGMIDLLLRKD